MSAHRLADGYPGKAPFVSARVVPDDIERLNRAARAGGITRSEFLRRALKAALDAAEPTIGSDAAQAVA